MIYDSLFKSLLFKLDPESAHHMIMNVGKNMNNQGFTRMLLSGYFKYQSPRLRQQIWNLSFPNPMGLAAGFDKNGKLPKLMASLGFGFTEVGSITAQPGSGNPKPRLFRLPEDHSLINRMGLNNDGAQTICRRLKNQKIDIPLGINIAKTHSKAIYGDKAIEDYIISYREANKVADYITINISCPNTKDGKSFEEPVILKELLDALDLRIDARRVPTIIKLSPDMSTEQMENIIEVCETFGIDGYAATNTSSRRFAAKLHTTKSRLKDIGAGGMSGEALRRRSTEVVRQLRNMLGPDKPIIGIGGIHSVESAIEKLEAGANLLQSYTGLIYEGPGLARSINKGIDNYLKSHRIESLSHYCELCGR